MATLARQPFAPLNEARLQTLTSLKNRQNAISNSSPVKRKASEVTSSDNSENVDPVLFSKRAKGADGFPSKDSFIKPSTFFLTKSASTNDLPVATPLQATTPRQRSLLNPKSPSAKLNTGIGRSPLSAPAGRSPTRKRSGLLSSRRRTGGSFTRVDPPVFGLAASSPATPFSLDAALRGTISNYANRGDVSSARPSSGTSDFSGLHEPEAKSSWFFDIHEDTESEEATNMLQHSALGLDISSDEESEKRLQRERAEGKENIPPPDDVSQTSYPRAARYSASSDEMVVEKERNPLGEMDPKEYYSKGCDENSVVVIPDDEDEEALAQEFVPQVAFSAPVWAEGELGSIDELEPIEEAKPASVEELMQGADSSAPLESADGADGSFEVWESSSAKDETEPVGEYC
ncbi:putative thymidylate kinase protein [Rosellinia necatrix]|uniref:Putative thymidylate kinase protein n=1 Tax=Rosellinia necatrix TaxID=77044 RepID=A0A1W2TWZ3_ROSNE|nr:putative thymidylate kinase protein [Rosellinia necatrix]